jgi:hypothetical protein
MVSMTEQPQTTLRSPCAMPSVGWSGVKLANIGLLSTFSGVMNHTTPSCSPTNKSGFGRCQENTSLPKFRVPTVKFGGG